MSPVSREDILQDLEGITEALDFYRGVVSLDSFKAADKVIERYGRGVLTFYDDMVDSDAIIAGLMDTRISQVVSLEWDVVPYSVEPRDTDIAEFVKEWMSNYEGFDDFLNNQLGGGLRNGFSVTLVNWELTEGKYLPESTISYCPDYFRFAPDRTLRVITPNSGWQGEPVPDYRFLILTYNPRYSNPYGVSPLRSVYWMWWFKHHGIKWWLQAAERGAVVTPVGKYERGSSDEEINKLEYACKNFLGNKYIITEKDNEITFPAIKADPTLTKTLIDMLDNDIRYRIEGSYLASGTSGTGSRALGEIHAQARQARLEQDAKTLQQTVNKLVKWIVEINFGITDYPLWVMDYEQAEDTEPLRRSMETMVQLGGRISAKRALELLRLPQADEDEDILTTESERRERITGMGGDDVENPDETAEQAEEPEPAQDADEAEEADVVIEKILKGTIRRRRRVSKCLTPERRVNNAERMDNLVSGALVAGMGEYNQIVQHLLSWLNNFKDLGEAADYADIYEPDMSSLTEHLMDSNFYSYLWGFSAIWENVEREGLISRKLGNTLALGDEWIPVKPEEAIERFRGRVPITRPQFDRLSDAMRTRSVTAAGMTRETIKQALKPSLISALDQGFTLETFTRKVGGKGGRFLNDFHAETVFRTNINSAYNQGHQDGFMDDSLSAIFPGVQYYALMDDRTTDICAERHGLIFTRESASSGNIAPPLHYNCRSTLLAVDIDQYNQGDVIPEGHIFAVPPMEGFGAYSRII